MYDSFNRPITYLRISVTDRCNLRCTYCMPAAGVPPKAHDQIVSYEQIARLVAAAATLGITKVRLTGGEPLVRKGIERLVAMLRGIEGITELTLTSNGLLLPLLAPALKRAGLDRVNVSLDTLDPERYRRLTRGGTLAAALGGIDAALEAGLTPVKVNMVVIPGENLAEVPQMQEFCRRRGLTLQRIRHYSLTDHATTRLAIPAERPTPCEECNRLRLTADGRLKPCLFSDLEIPVDWNDPAASLRQAIASKPRSGVKCTGRGNWQIGG
ncbi:MAG TPA: radical SAM protein [Candidatus Aminicenantes bacterium]|nr:radical SAM protein [Candidatus Aminicenantes bacterium]